MSSDVVTVQVSRELLERLTLDWSEPVQIMIRETEHPDATHEMICRKPVPAALIPSGFRLTGSRSLPSDERIAQAVRSVVSGHGDELSSAHEREQRFAHDPLGRRPYEQ